MGPFALIVLIAAGAVLMTGLAGAAVSTTPGTGWSVNEDCTLFTMGDADQFATWLEENREAIEATNEQARQATGDLTFEARLAAVFRKMFPGCTIDHLREAIYLDPEGNQQDWDILLTGFEHGIPIPE